MSCRPLPPARVFAGLRRAAERRTEARMVPFFVQIKCQLGKSYEVANKLADAELASEIYSTAGDYDLLVKFYVDEKTDIGHFIDVELHQQVVVAGGRVDFRGQLRVRELVRHLIGLAELAFDLDEEGDHS